MFTSCHVNVVICFIFQNVFYIQFSVDVDNVKKGLDTYRKRIYDFPRTSDTALLRFYEY